MTVALIVAAGSGERLGAGRPKALVELAGRELWEWSVEALRRTAEIELIVLAMPAEIDGVPARFSMHYTTPPTVLAVSGGASRSQSVRHALEATGAGDPVLVHDAARPLLTPELTRRVIAALDADPHADAAIAAAPVTDTIKRAGTDKAVIQTLDRGELWSVQTPQVFRREALQMALDTDEATLAQATDDAWLIERSGGRVIVVPSIHPNLKVTTPLDLRVAELLLQERFDPQS
jgi:2-C-methyl-D-erythritol 4-phosphate cytidylyltransferase